jgi:hypothetical protein
MPLIKMLNGTFTLQTGKILAGDVLEVDDETAKRWVDLGLAERATGKAAEQHRDEREDERAESQRQADETRAALERERQAARASEEHLAAEADNPAARRDPNQANAAAAESRARRGRE